MIATADFGLKSIYSGSVADDDYGVKFNEGMLEKGCLTDLKINKLPTGSSIILISEDAERTLNTYLGSCQEYSIKDINEEQIAQSKFLYFTGYMWDTESQKEALEKAIEIAKKNKTQIVFDVADPFAVSRSKEDFIRIMKEDADFILANYEEAKIFTEKDKIEEILKVLMSYIGSGVVKVGKKGSYFFKDGKVTKIDAFEVKAVDTTGAGDIYAAGILYGLVRKFDDVRTGKIASYVAAKCVENVGARLEFSLKDSIDKI